MTMQHKSFSADIEVQDGERAFIAKMTSAVQDRDREVLLPEGMDATDFEQNPIVFYGHEYADLKNVVGKVVGLKRDKDHWLGKVVLAARPKDHVGDWAPDTILSLVQQGIIRGVSVGFEPTQTRRPTKADLERFGDDVNRVYARWKLFELSIAPLPANQEALILAVSKGIVTREAVEAITPAVQREKIKRLLVPRRVNVDVYTPPVVEAELPRKRIKVLVPDLRARKTSNNATMASIVAARAKGCLYA